MFSSSPIIFNYVLDEKNNLKQGEPWNPCNPNFEDQLVGGYMKITNNKDDKKDEKKTTKNKKNDDDENGEETKNVNIKRRSPISVSAFRPIHPKLASVNKEDFVFSRNPTNETVRIVDNNGKELSLKEINDYLNDKNRTLPGGSWLTDSKTTGLYILDVAIDLRTLFCVQLNDFSKSLDKETEKKLRSIGWIESENVFGKCLVVPKKNRKEIIETFANALVEWAITSNQSRSYSPMETLAISISNNGNKNPNAIRAELKDDDSAELIIDSEIETDLFVTPVCRGYCKNINVDKLAIEKAEEYLMKKMSEFDYEKQIS